MSSRSLTGSVGTWLPANVEVARLLCAERVAAFTFLDIHLPTHCARAPAVLDAQLT